MVFVYFDHISATSTTFFLYLYPSNSILFLFLFQKLLLHTKVKKNKMGMNS